MQEEAKTKLVTAEEAATMLDLKRDYVYGRGVAVDREETHLRDYWRIIRRRLWVPISALILVVTLATIYNLRLPSIYEGVTEVELVREDRVVNLKDLQINMGGSDDSQYINTQLKIMQSPPVAYLVNPVYFFFGSFPHDPGFWPDVGTRGDEARPPSLPGVLPMAGSPTPLPDPDRYGAGSTLRAPPPKPRGPPPLSVSSAKSE